MLPFSRTPFPPCGRLFGMTPLTLSLQLFYRFTTGLLFLSCALIGIPELTGKNIQCHSHKGTIHKGRPHRGGRGVGPKADIVREVAWIYSYRSSQNADKGGGGPKTRKFCGRPLCMVPYESSAGVVSKRMNKIIDTWGQLFWQPLHMVSSIDIIEHHNHWVLFEISPAVKH